LSYEGGAETLKPCITHAHTNTLNHTQIPLHTHSTYRESIEKKLPCPLTHTKTTPCASNINMVGMSQSKLRGFVTPANGLRPRFFVACADHA